MPELLLGCGASREKKMFASGKEAWSELVTLDINQDHKPDVLWDLNQTELPFANDYFDECHAYECLEHCGQQGHFEFFFGQFSDFWRILKPGGLFFGTVPYWRSVWAWGDPSHTRVIPPENFTFLVQPEYTKQVGNTPMSDFRRWYKADFDILRLHVNDVELLEFVLRSVKPSRISI